VFQMARGKQSKVGDFNDEFLDRLESRFELDGQIYSIAEST
jgi:hypothetical protein